MNKMVDISNGDQNRELYLEYKDLNERVQKQNQLIDDINKQIDKVSNKMKEAITIQEVKALEQSKIKHDMQIETIRYKRKQLQTKASEIYLQLPDKYKSSAPYKIVTKSTTRGYTDQEKKELYDLIDSVK